MEFSWVNAKVESLIKSIWSTGKGLTLSAEDVEEVFWGADIKPGHQERVGCQGKTVVSQVEGTKRLGTKNESVVSGILIV